VCRRVDSSDPWADRRISALVASMGCPLTATLRPSVLVASSSTPWRSCDPPALRGCRSRRLAPRVLGHAASAVRTRITVDLCADDGMSDAHGVADPHAINLASLVNVMRPPLYARNGTSGGSTWAVRLRASNRPSRTDLRLSGSKTSLAKCRAEHVLLVRAEQLLSSPCLDDHESTIRRITQMHHEPVGGTAQVL
jgi:hypothetical protein